MSTERNHGRGDEVIDWNQKLYDAIKVRSVEGGGKVEEQTDEMDAITTPLLDRAGASRSSSLTAEQRRLVERGENPYGDSSSQRGRV
jgi:hypothetical protein